MCNFNHLSLETEKNCSSCKKSSEINKIVHSFTLNNGQELSIYDLYHCSHCGINFSATQGNHLDIGEEDRLKKAKFLFEETYRVPLNLSLQTIFGYYYHQKNQIQKFELFGGNSINAHFVHILNSDFINKKPTHFIYKNDLKEFVVTEENRKDSTPVLRAFVKGFKNYSEILIPFEAITFK